MNIKFKNYQSKSFVFLFAILTSWTAQAGSVTSTFTDGNALTGAQMTEIKNAVNDNSFTLDAADGVPANVLSVDNAGVIQTTTKVGINRTPIQELSVAGDLFSTSGAKLGGGTSEGSRSALLELRNTVPWSSVITATSGTGGLLFSLSNSGPATFTGSVTAASHITSSDSRYKKNIVSIVNPLETLLRLRGVNFEWDAKTFSEFKSLPGKQVGFIAQEVSEVLPETVFKNENGYLGVSYNAMIPLLVEAVKEQQQVIKGLTEELESFEDVLIEVRALREQINVIQANTDERSAVDEAPGLLQVGM